MRKAFFISSLILGLLAVVSFKSSNHDHITLMAAERLSHWGYVFLDSSDAPNAKNHIGKGGFEDEASCLSAANKRLAAYPELTHLELRCFENFEVFERPIIMA